MSSWLSRLRVHTRNLRAYLTVEWVHASRGVPTRLNRPPGRGGTRPRRAGARDPSLGEAARPRVAGLLMAHRVTATRPREASSWPTKRNRLHSHEPLSYG